MDPWRILPQYWFQNRETDWQWDAELRKALDEHPVEWLGVFMCRVGPYTVRVSSFPFYYGADHDTDSGLPSVATRRRLFRAVGKVMDDRARGMQAG